MLAPTIYLNRRANAKPAPCCGPGCCGGKGGAE